MKQILVQRELGAIHPPKSRAPRLVLSKLAKVVLAASFCFGIAQNGNAQVHDYGGWSIPENPRPKPNKDTLEFYLKRYLSDHTKFGTYASTKATDPVALPRELRAEEPVKKALRETSLLSYLLYEDGKVTVDELSPPDRFGHLVNDKTKLISMSLGKSIVSYVLGHAICTGTIKGLDQRVSDWPLLRGTLYQDATLRDLINMRAGDQLHVTEQRGFIKTGRSPNNFSVGESARNELQGTKPAEAYFNYNPLPPNIVLNYIIFRSGGNIDALMRSAFQEKARTEESVFFLRQPKGKEEDGLARSTFYATRYDYLRIAKAMLDDWHGNTCEGRYLKEILSGRSRKQGDGMRNAAPDEPFWGHRGYGGFFHTDFYALKSGRNIVAMQGFGGQMIVIDFDAKRIVSAHAIHNDFDWKGLVNGVIETGKIARKP